MVFIAAVATCLALPTPTLYRSRELETCA